MLVREGTTHGVRGQRSGAGIALDANAERAVDLHELYEQIRQKLNEMKAYGMPLPADLVQFEHDLEAEFGAEKADAERRARLDNVIAQRAKQ
jgi:hypothetical protein